MSRRYPGFVLAAALVSALSLAACNRTSSTPSGTTSAVPPSNTSARADAKQAADDATVAANRVGDATRNAADKTAQAASDSAITAKVKSALLAEPGLDSLDIHVDTKEGAVTLTGNVDAPAKRERAKQVATAVEGVRDVVDNLAVKRS